MVAAGKLYFTFLLVFFFVCRFGRPSQHGVDVDTVEKKKRISDFPPKRSFPVVFPFFYFIFLLKKTIEYKNKKFDICFPGCGAGSRSNAHSRTHTRRIGIRPKSIPKMVQIQTGFSPIYVLYLFGDKNKVLVGFHAQNVAVC